MKPYYYQNIINFTNSTINPNDSLHDVRLIFDLRWVARITDDSLLNDIAALVDFRRIK